MDELGISSQEQFFLAVDVGSNAMRAAIASLDEKNDLEILETLRFPLRLGEDVFKDQKISNKKIQKTIEAFAQLQVLNQKYRFKKMNIVATSALRDAMNGVELIKKVKTQTGLDIKIIDGRSEAKLIFQAVASLINIKEDRTMLIDIGGGSTEITLCDGYDIQFSKSYNCGTVRLLGCGNYKAQVEIIKNFITEIYEDLHSFTKKKPIDLCIGTGGNLRRMGILRKKFFARSNQKIRQVELSYILNEISQLTIEQRIRTLDMRQDRADVIIPASKIIEVLMQQFKIHEILLPKVGLKEGIIIDLLEKKYRNFYFN